MNDCSLHKVVIKLYEKSYETGNYIIVRKWEDFQFNQVSKWNWYFRYIAAKIQIEHPHRLVELSHVKYEVEDQNKKAQQILTNRLRSAKSKLTEWNNKIKQFESSYNEIFPINEHPVYRKAKQKIKEKETLKRELESRLKATKE